MTMEPVRRELFETNIVSVDGRPVQPIRATVMQQISPFHVVVIETDAQTNRVPPGRIVEIRLAPHLSVPISVQHDGLGGLRAGQRDLMVPVRQPIQALRDECLLHSVSFEVFNHRRISGNDPRPSSNSGRLLSGDLIEAAPWVVRIDELDDERSESRRHRVSIVRKDEASFSTRDALELMAILREFLSFIRGSSVGFSTVEGLDDALHKRYVRIGIDHFAPPYVSPRSWFSDDQRNSAIETLPRYVRAWKMAPRWNSLRSAIMFYREGSDSSSLLSRILFFCISLTALCHEHCEQTDKRLAEAIRTVLEKLGASTKVPNALPHLEAFRRKKNCNSGPLALVKLRNWMVHGDQEMETDVDDAVLGDASVLAKWYVEMLTLHRLGHTGSYWNTITETKEPVPWAGIP